MAVGAAVAAAVPVAVGQMVGVADAAVVGAVAAVRWPPQRVAGAVATGVAAVPLGVGATVAAAVAGAAVAAAVVPAAVLAADGVAQAPATLAALLAPNTLPTFGISNAPPTPPTTATAPTIARSRVRDRGSNLRSWLKTLLRYDTTPFPFYRVSLPGDHSSPAVVSCDRESRFFYICPPRALTSPGPGQHTCSSGAG